MQMLRNEKTLKVPEAGHWIKHEAHSYASSRQESQDGQVTARMQSKNKRLHSLQDDIVTQIVNLNIKNGRVNHLGAYHAHQTARINPDLIRPITN